MIYRIEPEIFDLFPSFYRGIVVARGIDNSRPDADLRRQLDEQQERVRGLADGDGAHARLAAWSEAYRQLGVDPERYTPSIVFLTRRIRAGKPLASISPAVDVFNLISLKHLVPAGGDSVDALAGDLTLGLATGEESFSPIGKPGLEERPSPGEVIYVNRRSNRALCRRWNWRNADFSKITPETRNLVINVDGMTSAVPRPELEEATETLAQLLLRSCQGLVAIHFLDRSCNELEIMAAGV